MNKINQIEVKEGQLRRSAFAAVLLISVSVLLSGCYTVAAVRDYQRVGGTTPWWCKGSPDLTQQECIDLSLRLDIALNSANQYPTAAAFAGTEIANRPTNIGVPFTKVAIPTTFNPNAPNVLLYDGNTPTSRLVGVAWAISGSEPAGFVGDHDAWTFEPISGNWWLTAWVARGYENHPNVFAASHPCLTSTGTILTSTTNQCFLDSHTEPFEILVTNDDGYGAPGIDALVEGLYGLPNVVVEVVAPYANQSGAGSGTTPPGYTVTGIPALTASGKTATAVTSTYLAAPRNGSGSPADSVLYALGPLSLSPDVVISGINLGQNIGPLSALSGTVGAARIARQNGVASIATSQGGFAEPVDFPAGVFHTLALIEEWRLGHSLNTTANVLTINIPTCAAGSIRGTKQTIVAPVLGAGQSYSTQDCLSTQTVINDDIDALNHGFVGIADVGAKKPPNWP
jgi:5'-nucleotidase